MGFLSAYADVETILLDDRGYWVKVKKHLSRGEVKAAEAALANATADMAAGAKTPTMSIRPDTAQYRNLIVTAAIVDWNLDEEDGTRWALEPAAAKSANVDRLPDDMFDTIFQVVDSRKRETTAERRRFPGGDAGGDTDGPGRAAGAIGVSPRAGDVEAAGTPAGGPGQPTRP